MSMFDVEMWVSLNLRTVNVVRCAKDDKLNYVIQMVYMNFSTKNLLACLCSAISIVETRSIIFPYLVIVYPQIQDPINLIYMSTTYLESFGADLTENKPLQCVSILLTGTSTLTGQKDCPTTFPSITL